MQKIIRGPESAAERILAQRSGGSRPDELARVLDLRVFREPQKPIPVARGLEQGRFVEQVRFVNRTTARRRHGGQRQQRTVLLPAVQEARRRQAGKAIAHFRRGQEEGLARGPCADGFRQTPVVRGDPELVRQGEGHGLARLARIPALNKTAGRSVCRSSSTQIAWGNRSEMV